MSRLFIIGIAVYCIVAGLIAATARSQSIRDIMLMDDIQTAINEARQSIEDKIDDMQNPGRSIDPCVYRDLIEGYFSKKGGAKTRNGALARQLAADACAAKVSPPPQFGTANDPAALERLIAPGAPELVWRGHIK